MQNKKSDLQPYQQMSHTYFIGPKTRADFGIQIKRLCNLRKASRFFWKRKGCLKGYQSKFFYSYYQQVAKSLKRNKRQAHSVFFICRYTRFTAILYDARAKIWSSCPKWIYRRNYTNLTTVNLRNRNDKRLSLFLWKLLS